MKTRHWLCGLVLAALPMGLHAQGDEVGIWASLAAEKKFNKTFTVGAEAELRTRDDAAHMDRRSLGVYASYKALPWLKVQAGYMWLNDYYDKQKYYEEDDIYTGTHFWGKRHRLHASATASTKAGRFGISLRERWQYTYRPSKTVSRASYQPSYDDDGNVVEVEDLGYEDHTYKSKARNVLRSRLQVDYNIRHCPVTPYVSAELTNAWNIQKVRYAVGADWKITKQHIVGLGYKFQRVYKDGEDEPNLHVISLGYKFRF